MKSIRTVSAAIAEVEGFDVRLVAADGDGRDLDRMRVDDYPYRNAANRTWTVAKWREKRFGPYYPDFDVEVLDADCRVVHGKTLVSTVRATYEEIVEEPLPVPAALAESVSQHERARRPEPGARPSTATKVAKAAGATPLGFEATLWAAADKLRGSMDSSEYKHVVLGLVFLKYIDDAFAERHSELAADLAGEGFDEAAAEELLESRDEYTAEGVFWVPPEARWPHLQASAKQPEIGKLIDNAMDLVEIDNSSLRGVLPKTYSRPALDVRRLGELVDLISGVGLGSAEHREKDILGRVYEYFLGRFAAQIKGPGGDFYTPRNIVRLLVEMIEPYQGRVSSIRPKLWPGVNGWGPSPVGSYVIESAIGLSGNVGGSTPSARAPK